LPYENGRKIIRQISAIGSSLAGRIHCIITGSSLNLRQLCFAKLPTEECQYYENYTHKDLNSTKYSSKWIYPFLEINDFENLTQFYYKDFKLKYNNEDEIQKQFNIKMYLNTSGNPGLMSEFISKETCDSYSVSLRHFNSDNYSNKMKLKILETLYKCANATIDINHVSSPEELPTNLSAFQSWTKYISYQTFLNEFVEEHGNDFNDLLPYIYDLTDSGHIRYLDEKKTPNGWIGLGSSLIYLQLASKGKFEITIDEAAALKFPSGQPNQSLAENVTLRYLAHNAHKFLQVLSDFKISTHNIDKLCLRKNQSNKCSNDMIYLNCNDLDQITNRLFKEVYENNKDVFGADGILLENDKTKENTFIVHRIQIKLGTSNIKKTDAENIINKIKTNNANFIECFESAKKIISHTF
jgi:hypothetical protein